MLHAHNLYIYTSCFDSRGRFVDSGTPILQWEDDSNQNCLWTPTDFDCTKWNWWSNHCGHRWFKFHKNVENTQYAWDAHQRHICSCPKVFIMCISFSSEAPKLTFDTCPSEPHETMKYLICQILGLRKCASSEHITLCSDCWCKTGFL